MSELYVEASGSGAPLAMLHGWGLNLRVFDAFADALEEFRVVRPDLPGHGRSAWTADDPGIAAQARRVAEVLRSHADRWAVLGWSMGGQIALELAALEPALVQRLVLIAATPRFAGARDWPHGMTAEALDSFADRLRHDWRRTVSEFLELQVRGSAEGERTLRQLQAALVSHGEARPEALAAGLANLRTEDLRPRLDHIVQPALVISGQYDRITRPGASRALAGRLVGGRLLEIRRAGHAPFLSHAGEVARAVRDFLA
jgi:pimeloyl-[acyl-carrier protein] methyl ester esterase